MSLNRIKITTIMLLYRRRRKCPLGAPPHGMHDYALVPPFEEWIPGGVDPEFNTKTVLTTLLGGAGAPPKPLAIPLWQRPQH